MERIRKAVDNEEELTVTIEQEDLPPGWPPDEPYECECGCGETYRVGDKIVLSFLEKH